MKVVISGYYGFHNEGDEAILYSIIQALRTVEPSIEITVLSNDPDHTATAYQVEAVNRWSLMEVTQAIHTCDGLISGGGSLIQDKTSDRSVIYYTGVVFLAQKLGKPVFIYAQGVGPIEQKKNKWLTQKALQQATAITVRDPESKTLLQEIGVEKEIEVVPDPVLGLNRKETMPSLWLTEQNLDKPLITVSIRPWATEKIFLKEIASVCDYFVTEGYELLFLPMHANSDEDASEVVLSYMGKKARIVPAELGLDEKLGIINASTLVIGMRLHALIFAALTGTPFVALSYDPKIDSFAKLCAQPVVGHVEHFPPAADVIAVINQQLQSLEMQKKALTEFTIAWKEKAIETAQKAISCFR